MHLPRKAVAKRLPVLLAVLLGTSPAGLAETPWSRAETVSRGAAEAIGGPANGCLRGAERLPASGDGFVSIRRHRNRYYGHPQTLDFVSELGRTVAAGTGRLMMIGDLSQPRGGRMASSHISHQNGLDVDIWLSLADSPEQAWRRTPEAQDPPSMLGPGARQLGARWSADQVLLIRSAAEHPAVDRILVNPVIKRALCRSQGQAPWLRKLRPWWGHDAHMHVRLTCPPASPHCQQQSPIPPGSGCGSPLAWWFSEEATTPSGGQSDRRPQPPRACRALLDAS